MKNFTRLVIAVCVLVQGILTQPLCADHIHLRLGGSSTVYPIIKETLPLFEQISTAKKKHVFSEVSQSSSGNGIKRLAEGSLEIAAASRKMTLEERKYALSKGKTLVQIPIGYDVIAIISHKKWNITNSIPYEDVRKIFFTCLGRKKVYPRQMESYVRGKDYSGTAKSFKSIMEKLVLEYEGCAGIKWCGDAKSAVDSEDLHQLLSERSQSISFLSRGSVDDRYRHHSILMPNGRVVNPTDPSVIAGEYPFSRSLYLIVEYPFKAGVAEYLDYMTSVQINPVVRRLGYLPLFSHENGEVK